MTELEKHELNKFFIRCCAIKNNLDDKSDSICDVAQGQVEVVAEDPEEQKVLDDFMEFIKNNFNHIVYIADNAKVLQNHFVKNK